MSRIGRMPIQVPAGVTVTRDGNFFTFKGAKGELSYNFHSDIIINVSDNVITVERPDDEQFHIALHGLTRTLISNMVEGVSKGFTKELEISEGGYRAAKKGNQLVMNLGYSHDVIFTEEPGITFECPTPNKVIVFGLDKQRVGQIASEIRAKRPPEPYLGKGVRYAGEYIRRKSGKAGK